jgi:hypothetical protein
MSNEGLGRFPDGGNARLDLGEVPHIQPQMAARDKQVFPPHPPVTKDQIIKSGFDDLTAGRKCR